MSVGLPSPVAAGEGAALTSFSREGSDPFGFALEACLANDEGSLRGVRVGARDPSTSLVPRFGRDDNVCCGSVAAQRRSRFVAARTSRNASTLSAISLSSSPSFTWVLVMP